MAAAAPQATGSPPGRRWRLHSVLIALVLAALLPAVTAAALSIWRAAASSREATAVRLLETARALAGGVESELQNSAAILRTLAVAPVSARGTSEDFATWLARMASAQHWHVIVQDVAEATASTAPLLDGGAVRAAVLAAARDDRPVLSDLYELPGYPGGPVVSIAVPRPEAGRAAPARQVLALVVEPQQLVRSLQQLPAASLLVGVTDGSGRIVARSRDLDHYLGKRSADWDRIVALGGDSGILESPSGDSVPMMLAFRKLRGTPGWTVVAAEPLAAYNARWQQPLLLVAGGALLALLLAGGVGAWLTRTVLRPMRLLAERAEAVAAEQHDTPPPSTEGSHIVEFETLRDSLATAETALRRRAEAHAVEQRRYRTLAEAGALVLWRTDAQGFVVAATGWRELTGQGNDEVCGTRWMRQVHPDDLPLIEALRVELVAGRRLIDLECRVRTALGSWRWVRGRGAPVIGPDKRIDEWVGVVEDVDERRQAQARVAHMAQHDSMTGLANRVRFREALEGAIQRAGRGESGAVLCIDLDRFKEVNDTLGHPTGDALLCAVTERLRLLVRETDTVARLGGDEFAIQQAGLAKPDDAVVLATRVVEVLSEPYDLAGQQIVIGASVGIALITDRHLDADALLKHADLALYRAKTEGRGRYCFFDQQMGVHMQARRQLELELRQGFASGQFELYYQPLVDVRTRAVSGFEALLRWRHPVRGLLLPEAFLSLCEDIGLIVPIGEWVLREACRQALAWQEAPPVSVNVSTVQLRHRGLFDAVMRALQASGLPAARLEIEINERALLESADTVLATLRRLHGQGVRIAIGDFGTGHSSLGCLRSFPFDKVKIDRSFVRDLGVRKDGDAIVRAVTSLCDSLGIATAAEGVETEAQLRLLSEEYCTEAQGFLFSEARPADELPEVFRMLRQRAEMAARRDTAS